MDGVGSRSPYGLALLNPRGRHPRVAQDLVRHRLARELLEDVLLRLERLACAPLRRVRARKTQPSLPSLLARCAPSPSLLARCAPSPSLLARRCLRACHGPAAHPSRRGCRSSR
eukprot:2869568-Prymnesium_polylepis.2